MKGYMQTAGLGGYDKSQALRYIDAYNMRIYQLEKALADGTALPPFNPPPRPQKTLIGGFNTSDFDAYESDLIKKTAELEQKLK